jgi:CRISPR-associated endonuclease Csn1
VGVCYHKYKNKGRIGMRYILALDIGVASVGWAVIDKDNEKVLEAGSNLFPEGTANNNKKRRSMRGTRRLIRRRKNRINDFARLWTDNGFQIPKGNNTNIVGLKIKALKEKISLDELYFVLYSYMKHRGISYLEDAGDESVTGSSAYAIGLQINASELSTKFPSEIQNERLQKYGKYRGQIETKNKDGEKVDLNNVFTINAYRKEIQQILTTQEAFHEELTSEFGDEYLTIFNRKRKYYEGPGNENSRTDYGKYTTKIGDDGKYITEDNIFEKLIGHCSVYPEELRASTASYTAQEFNLLNDLNNLKVNGRKLEENEKRAIVDKVKNSNRVNMRKIIADAIGEKIETLDGARIDKSKKEIFHKFEAYNKMRKALEEIDADITFFSREELDEIGYILTINTDKEALIEAFNKSSVDLKEDIRESLINLRKRNGILFKKWHSFSLKIMNELIPEMYAQPKEQMTLLTEMGVFKNKQKDLFTGLKKIPVDAASEDIFNPVVKRSVRISFKILNAILDKYGAPEKVVIEMPRDKNSDEEKDRINKAKKNNEEELSFIENKLLSEHAITLTTADYSKQKQFKLKLKLWNEQDGQCLYSDRPIEIKDLIYHPELFQIDHIIPRSISFDDSRSNKVLVYATENWNKGQQTPYYYFTYSDKAKITFERFRALVMNLRKKKDYGLSPIKVRNLLFTEDITRIDVQKGFINRNLNDTRYASRVILNIVQSFFGAHELDTKVKVIRGSYTHQMRVNMKLDKNRDESFSHHAVDAMLIGFSQMGYEAYRKLQGTFIDFETGEILDKNLWNTNMTDDVYKDYLYRMKWSNIRNEITEGEKKVKYWHFVDHKANRGLCNQTIYGTREYDGKTYKINKLDIRTKKGFKLFKQYVTSKNIKDREKLLVYKNDRKTYDDLVQIMKEYEDADNPFVQYERETGDYVRKYAKNHKGPRIDKLKYVDGAVGSCIDISHKYGHEKGSQKVILESSKPYRMDVYLKKFENAYYFVGVKQSGIKYDKGVLMIDEEAYAATLVKEKMIKNGQTRDDLEDLGFEFQMSFYKNDIIEYELNGKMYTERFLSRTMPARRNYIETKPITKFEFDERHPVGLRTTQVVKKYRMDILGNYYLNEQEKFAKIVKN